jgi:hypothetical protein
MIFNFIFQGWYNAIKGDSVKRETHPYFSYKKTYTMPPIFVNYEQNLTGRFLLDYMDYYKRRWWTDLENYLNKYEDSRIMFRMCRCTDVFNMNLILVAEDADVGDVIKADNFEKATERWYIYFKNLELIKLD